MKIGDIGNNNLQNKLWNIQKHNKKQTSDVQDVRRAIKTISYIDRIAQRDVNKVRALAGPIVETIEDVNRILGLPGNNVFRFFKTWDLEERRERVKRLAREVSEKQNKPGSGKSRQHYINEETGDVDYASQKAEDSKKQDQLILAKNMVKPIGMVGKWASRDIGGEEYGAAIAKAKVINGGKFPFRIKNLASGVQISLPATIENFNEDVSASWNQTPVINRSEDIYIYQKSSRQFTVELVLYADTAENLNNNYMNSDYPYIPLYVKNPNGESKNVPMLSKKMMWDTMEFLHGCTKPKYDENNGRFIKAPYCLLTIGDVLRSSISVIERLNFAYEKLWDVNTTSTKINGGIRPMMVKVTIGGTLLHRKAPGVDMTGEFYPNSYTP